MKVVSTIAAVLVLIAWTIVPVPAQRLVSALSDKEVSIDSSFAGETLTLFGNVEASLDADAGGVKGPFDIVIVIRGPALDRAVRQKKRVFGIWLNIEQLVFKNFPSFFWVLSSDRLDDVAAREVLEVEGILPAVRPQLTIVQGSGNPNVFGPEMVRLMTENGLFGVDERGVRFRSNTLYSARVVLPANVPNGNFLAHTYLFKDGVIVSEKAEGFSVRKEGFERLLGTAAQEIPWVYGFVSVFVAIFTGWLGGVVFRR